MATHDRGPQLAGRSAALSRPLASPRLHLRTHSHTSSLATGRMWPSTRFRVLDFPHDQPPAETATGADSTRTALGGGSARRSGATLP